jgi:phage host-nuclease inhibitor protein Gam
LKSVEETPAGRIYQSQEMKMDIKQKLDQLAELQAQKEYLALQKQALIDSVLTAEIKAKLAEIDAEFAPQSEAVDTNIDALTTEIKADVIQAGTSVKGTHCHAIYTKGRVSWDSKMLEGMAILIPQINDAKKTGEPSVSIRKI